MLIFASAKIKQKGTFLCYFLHAAKSNIKIAPFMLFENRKALFPGFSGKEKPAPFVTFAKSNNGSPATPFRATKPPVSIPRHVP